jgi:hypothetical protein
LHVARVAEVTSLWRLSAKKQLFLG